MLAVVTVDTALDVIDFDDGVTSLREAIFATNTVLGSDEIVFDFDHDGPETLRLTLGELKITDSLTITGSGPELLTIDASGNDPTSEENNGDGSRIFNVDDDDSQHFIDVMVMGISLTGGDAQYDGGAIYSLENITIEDVHFSSNYSGGNGGALFTHRAETKLSRSRFTENSSGHSGGGVYTQESSLTINDSVISHNQAADGGGVRFFSGALLLEETEISGNSSAYLGGGIYVEDLNSSEIANNFNDSGIAPDLTGFLGAVISHSFR